MQSIAHGAVWLTSYVVIGLLDLLANLITCSVLGIPDGAAVILSYIVAIVVALYWAHRIAVHVAPLPKKDTR